MSAFRVEVDIGSNRFNRLVCSTQSAHALMTQFYGVLYLAPKIVYCHSLGVAYIYKLRSCSSIQFNNVNNIYV